MTLSYVLTENDFLQYELYLASQSDRVKKQMTRGRVSNFIFFMSIGYFFYSGGSKTLGIYFIIVGVLMVTLFPLYSKWRYKNYYKRQVRQQSSSLFNLPVSFTAEGENIEVISSSAVAKFKLSEATSVDETGDHLFISFSEGAPLIIPKQKSSDSADLLAWLNSSLPAETPYTENLKWKW